MLRGHFPIFITPQGEFTPLELSENQNSKIIAQHRKYDRRHSRRDPLENPTTANIIVEDEQAFPRAFRLGFDLVCTDPRLAPWVSAIFYRLSSMILQFILAVQ